MTLYPNFGYKMKDELNSHNILKITFGLRNPQYDFCACKTLIIYFRIQHLPFYDTRKSKKKTVYKFTISNPCSLKLNLEPNLFLIMSTYFSMEYYISILCHLFIYITETFIFLLDIFLTLSILVVPYI